MNYLQRRRHLTLEEGVTNWKLKAWAWPVDISRPWSLKDNSGEVAFVDRISDIRYLFGVR